MLKNALIQNKKIKISYLVASLLTLVISSAQAKSIFDIKFFESLTSIDSRYPDLIFKEKKLCDTRDYDKCFIVEGSALDGIVFFVFADSERTIKRKLAEALEEQKIASIGEQLHLQKKILDYQSIIARPRNDQLLMKNFIWIPETKILVQRLHKKFGKPEKEYLSDNLSLIQVFKNGVRAIIDPDGITSSHILFEPTEIPPY